MTAQAFASSVDTTSDPLTQGMLITTLRLDSFVIKTLQQLPSSPSLGVCLHYQHFFPTHSSFLFLWGGEGGLFLGKSLGVIATNLRCLLWS